MSNGKIPTGAKVAGGVALVAVVGGLIMWRAKVGPWADAAAPSGAPPASPGQPPPPQPTTTPAPGAPSTAGPSGKIHRSHFKLPPGPLQTIMGGPKAPKIMSWIVDATGFELTPQGSPVPASPADVASIEANYRALAAAAGHPLRPPHGSAPHAPRTPSGAAPGGQRPGAPPAAQAPPGGAGGGAQPPASPLSGLPSIPGLPAPAGQALAQGGKLLGQGSPADALSGVLGGGAPGGGDAGGTPPDAGGSGAPDAGGGDPPLGAAGSSQAHRPGGTSATGSHQPHTVKLKSAAEVYPEPGGKGRSLGEIPAGTSVTLLGRPANGWAHINVELKHHHVSGWISELAIEFASHTPGGSGSHDHGSPHGRII